MKTPLLRSQAHYNDLDVAKLHRDFPLITEVRLQGLIAKVHGTRYMCSARM